MPEVAWLTAFLDLPAPVWERGTAFWAAASGATLSPLRGPDRQFATLLPASGDAAWRVQRVGGDVPGMHLDLHAADPARLEQEVLGLGATLVAVYDDVTVLRSPGGQLLCVVGAPGTERPDPGDHGSHRSALDQVCLDVPVDLLAREVGFWASVLDAEVVPSRRYPELTDLRRPGHAVRVLVQEVGHDGPVTAHPDLATDDRPAEVARLLGLGAGMESELRHWTVLVAPDGRRFCVTDRDPWTGD